jgi:hypothetical protein
MATSLVKTILYKSLAEGVYKDIVTRSSSYFYFLGKTLKWDDENNPPLPVDSYDYENAVRNEIITIKEIRPSDVAFVIPRKDWVADVVYDMYDDQYSDQVIGINIISGGTGYIDLYDTQITISGGGGSGATAVVSEVVGGAISGVVMTNHGSGYTSEPTVTITSPSGNSATLKATMGITKSGVQKLEDSNFYVVTDDYNVYKCLDNNNNARSTYKPSGTQLDPIKTQDGYIWKFMYNIPINLRNKFYTDEYVPVVSALTNHFYSNGTIDNIFIANKGKNYTTAQVSVTGDGYRAADPIYIQSAAVVNSGSMYTNPTIEFSAPYGASSPFLANSKVNLGQVIYNSTSFDYYEVTTPGNLSSVPPTHRFGTYQNGSAALKFVGTKLKGYVTTTNPKNITEINLTQGGSSYTSPPTVNIVDSTGVNATAVATIGKSSILSVTVTNGGSGYVAPQLTVVPAPGDTGTGAVLQANVTGGVITSVTVVNGGSEFSQVPTVNIIDSSGVNAVLTPVLTGTPVQSIQILNSGSGYTNPTISISGGGGAGAEATAVVETGIINDITLIGSIRDVVVLNPGSGYIEPPEVVLSGGGGSYAVVKSKLYADKVISTYVVNHGDDYLTPPTVTFGTPWQAGLEVYTNQQYSNGSYLYTVVNAGFFGSSEPVHLSGTVITSPAWVANTSVTLNQTVYVSNRMYKVIVAGMTGSSAPTHTSGIVANGTASLEYVGEPASLRRDGTVATGFAILRYGAGYNTTPTVTFTDATGSGAEINFLTAKSEASISAITENGQIVFLIINDPGIGYTKASLEVTGNIEGTGAQLVADLSLGSISSQQANNEILTPAGTIDAIAIISGGYSYGVANILIEGDGSGATAEAVIDPLTNAITKVNITNRGEGYTYANVKVIGNGNGATFRAIISPFGGHGKNAPEELFARSLMFYSNISTDLNQGVVVGNDYRQVGVLKNPRVFDGFENFQGSIGSACYIIQTQINTARFGRDDELYIERVRNPSIQWSPSLQMTIGEFLYVEDRIYTVVVSGLGGSEPPTTTTGSEVNGFAVLTYVGSTKSKKRYRIVSLSETSALVQSLDNDIPEANDVFIKTSSITDNFTAVSVGLPTFDKYSGQLMYIDNKQGFTPSGDETITLRTIIKF